MKANGSTPANPFLVAIETMRGDLRDAVIELMKRQQKPWAKLSEQQQRLEIRFIENFATDWVQKAVPLIRAEGVPHVACRVDKVVIDDKGSKLQLGGVPATDDATIDVAHLQGKRIVITEASTSHYLGERAPAPIQKDQPDMLEAAGSKPAARPASLS